MTPSAEVTFREYGGQPCPYRVCPLCQPEKFHWGKPKQKGKPARQQSWRSA